MLKGIATVETVALTGIIVLWMVGIAEMTMLQRMLLQAQGTAVEGAVEGGDDLTIE
jgi:hypothetical protein